MQPTNWNDHREPTLTRDQVNKATKLLSDLLGKHTGFTVESYGGECCLIVYLNIGGNQSKFNFTIDDYNLLVDFKD